MGRKGGQSTVAGVYSGFVKNPKYVMKQGAEENGRGVRSGRLLKWVSRYIRKEDICVIGKYVLSRVLRRVLVIEICFNFVVLKEKLRDFVANECQYNRFTYDYIQYLHQQTLGFRVFKP